MSFETVEEWDKESERIRQAYLHSVGSAHYFGTTRPEDLTRLITELIGKRPNPLPKDKRFIRVTNGVGYLKYGQNAHSRQVEFLLDNFIMTDGDMKACNSRLLREISGEFAKAASFIEGKDVEC